MSRKEVHKDSGSSDPARVPWNSGRAADRSERPPDLEEILRGFVRRLGRGFEDRSGRADGGGGAGGGSMVPSLPWVPLLLLGAIVLLFQMFYTIDEQERGLVLRFGRHVATLEPGLSLRFPPPIERVQKVNVGQVRTNRHEDTMLTKDENLVSVGVVVQWRIGNPEQYQFNIVDPGSTFSRIIESVVREVIGTSDLDFVLTEGRGEIIVRQQNLMQEVLDEYRTGILVARVEMQAASPPPEVKAAFDDAIKAREDEQRLVNEAEAYRNDLLPRARGASARLLEDSNAYKARIVARADGEAQRFLKLLGEYRQAPRVTRERLYLETLESVMARTSKVLLDSGDGNLLMLPIDSLLRQRVSLPALRSGGTGLEAGAASDSGVQPAPSDRMRRRERER